MAKGTRKSKTNSAGKRRRRRSTKNTKKRKTRRRRTKNTKKRKTRRRTRRKSRRNPVEMMGGSNVPATSKFSEPINPTKGGFDLPPILSFYGMEGCKHCVNFAPTWEELVTSQIIRDNNIGLNLVQTYGNMPVVPNTAITGYPSLVLSHPGSVGDVMFSQQYPKTTDNIINWLMELNMIKRVDNFTTNVADAATSAMGF